jgi:phosphatidylserine/phosphatidylglycerophosphate/cardiolipin synthase-like enzyme/UDP-N-acetylglucosamine:LPS N-acetylglucosamine transferase
MNLGKTFILILSLLLQLSVSVHAQTSVNNVEDPQQIAEGVADAFGNGTLALPVLSQKPKIVVFWASIGFGHLTASQSVEAEIKRIYPHAEVILKDVNSFKNPIKNYIVKKGYDLTTKFMPGAYDTWFRSYVKTGETIPSLGDMSAGLAQRPDLIAEYLETEKPDFIVSSFMHVTEALIFLRDGGKFLDVPMAQVMTDYVNVKYFERLGERVDMSFVPHDAIRDTWIRNGFPAAKVKTTGIPVNALASVPISANDRIQFLQQNQLNPSQEVVVLVSGSAGVGNFGDAVLSISAQSEGKFIQIVAVTGKSTTNYDRLMSLKSKLPKNIDLRVHKLVPQADLLNYMKSADIIVTKTGGLSISEVAVIGKPMVVMDINGGQESYNSEFFAEQKMALAVKKESQVGTAVEQLINEPATRDAMIAAQTRYSKMVDVSKISDWVNRSIEKKAADSAKKEANYGNQNYALFLSEDAEVGAARWDFIKNERTSISAVYYMMDGNKVGAAALAGYREAAKAGATVRLILDGWAPERWIDAKFDPGMLKAAIADGVQIKIFNPVDLSNPLNRLRRSTYMRTHDKLSIFGGQNVLDLGDRNFQNVNFGLAHNSDVPGYRSAETFLKGPAVKDAAAYFDEIWNSSRVKMPQLQNVSPAQLDQGRIYLDRYARVMQNAELTGSHVPVDWVSQMKPVSDVEFFHDSVEHKGEVKGSGEKILEIIRNARNSLTIVSPYIVLTPEFKQAIYDALARHVEVTIITAGGSATDVDISSYSFETQAKDLQAAGARIFFHQGPKLMHAKIIQADGERSAVMTHNLDVISEYLNLESGISMKGEILNASVNAFVQEIVGESAPFTERTPISVGKELSVCSYLLATGLYPSIANVK